MGERPDDHESATTDRPLRRPPGHALVLIGCVDPCPLRNCPHDGSSHEHTYATLRRSPAGRIYLDAGHER